MVNIYFFHYGAHIIVQQREETVTTAILRVCESSVETEQLRHIDHHYYSLEFAETFLS